MTFRNATTSAGAILKKRAASPIERPDHQIVSLVGNISADGSASFYDTVGRLADRTGARHYPMPLPFLMSSEDERNRMLREDIAEGPLLDLLLDYDALAPRILQGALGDVLAQAKQLTGNLPLALTQPPLEEVIDDDDLEDEA